MIGPAAHSSSCLLVDRVFRFFLYGNRLLNLSNGDNLKRYGGFVPGIRPGKNTAIILIMSSRVCCRRSLLAIVCIIPEWLRNELRFRSFWHKLLTVVTVMMDTVARVIASTASVRRSYKKSRLRGRRG